MYFQEIWHRLLPKARVQSLNKLLFEPLYHITAIQTE